jgi:hypothetical protein
LPFETPDDRKAVDLSRTVQRAWITFRDAECDYPRSASEGRSIYPLTVSMRPIRLMEERVKQLATTENAMAAVHAMVCNKLPALVLADAQPFVEERSC